MKTSDFNFDLPERFIAQTAAEPRDHSKLLVYNKANNKTEINYFYDIINYLQKGDVIVINTTRVMDVRYVKKQGFVDSPGSVPLPPYIKTELKDKERYQTVYNNKAGSLAAPTAGLHWTPELMQQARDKGVIFCEVLLHVGVGTFRPVRCENITEHKMHPEYYEVTESAAKIINDAKAEGRRVIACGTTSVRTLESVYAKHGRMVAECGETNIFIYPPYKFGIVDAIITNFHLPKSTLIMLVSAFVGCEKVLELYEFAKYNDFRFYSFGDACLIL